MIFTFYSYKGGVGRSMALANVAEWLYRQGLRVVMIDWDLEAPGLENFFVDERSPQAIEALQLMRSQLGLIDALLAYKRAHPRLANALGTLDENGGAAHEDASPSAGSGAAQAALDRKVRVLDEHLPPLADLFCPIHPPAPTGDDDAALWLLTSGWRAGERFPVYAQIVQSFDWAEFYASYDGEAYFEWMRRQLRDESLADVVLIDSRTGVTEMGGICTRQLADVVVSFCAPNVQNLAGVETMAASFRRPEIEELRGRPLTTVVVPTRIDLNEKDLRLEFEERFRAAAERFTPAAFKAVHRELWDLRIPYVPAYSYAETLAIGSPKADKDLEKTYVKLATHLGLLVPVGGRVRQRLSAELQHEFGSLLPGVCLAYAPDAAGEAAALRARLEEAGVGLFPDLVAADADPQAEWRQGTTTIGQARFFVALDSSDTLASRTIRRLWRYARQEGVATCLVGRAAIDAETADSRERMWKKARRFSLDVEADELMRFFQSPPVGARAPQMAPEIVDRLVDRPSEMASLERAVLGDGDSRAGRKVLLVGPPGCGKTSLATAVCLGDAVSFRFDDGILWGSLGPGSSALDELTKMYGAVTGERPAFVDESDAARTLAAKLVASSCLIVLDDAWDANALRPFFELGETHTYLIVSRRVLDLATGGPVTTVTVGSLSAKEAEEMLSDLHDGELGERRVAAIAERLERLPLALRLASVAARRRTEQGSRDEPVAYLERAIEENGVLAFDASDATSRNESIAVSIRLSLDRLSEEDLVRLAKLSSERDAPDVTLAQACRMWDTTETEAEETMRRLAGASLLTYDAATRTGRLDGFVQAVVGGATPSARTDAAAEASFARLDESGRDMARYTLTRLVRLARPDEYGVDSAVRLSAKDLSAEAQAMINALGQVGLVRTETDKATGDKTVGFANDRMATEWTRLRTWIEEDREKLLVLQQVRALAAEWDHDGRSRSARLHGRLLARAVNLAGRPEPYLSRLEREYVEASVLAERRETRQRASRIAVAVGLIVGVVALGGYAWKRNRGASSAEAAKIRGEQSLKARDYDGAIAAFNEVIDLSPDATIYCDRGDAYLAKGDFDHALADADSALGLQPDFAIAYVLRGDALRGKAGSDAPTLHQAEEAYNRAIALDGKLADAYVGRGIVYQRLANPKAALDDLDEASNLKSTSAELYLARGELRAQSDPTGALADFASAERLTQDSALLKRIDAGRQSIQPDPTTVRSTPASIYIQYSGTDPSLANATAGTLRAKGYDVRPVQQVSQTVTGDVRYYFADDEQSAEEVKALVDVQAKKAKLPKALSLVQADASGRTVTPGTIEVWLPQIASAPAQTTIVVYSGPGDSGLADAAVSALKARGLAVAPVQPYDAALSGDVRYYHTTDIAAAKTVLDLVTSAVVRAGWKQPLALKYRPEDGDTLAPGTIHVYLPGSKPVRKAEKAA